MDEGKKRIKLKLSKPQEVRKSLSKICNMVANGEIDVKYANSITAICNSILGSIRIDEQEKKLAQLQNTLETILNEKED